MDGAPPMYAIYSFGESLVSEFKQTCADIRIFDVAAFSLLALCLVFLTFGGAFLGGHAALRQWERDSKSADDSSDAAEPPRTDAAAASLGYGAAVADGAGSERSEEGDDNHPAALVCAITSELFRDPVCAMDGHSCTFHFFLPPSLHLSCLNLYLFLLRRRPGARKLYPF